MAENVKKATFLKLIFGNRIQTEREVHRINVSTRIAIDVVHALDALIELGVFSSRSEAVSTYLDYAILSQPQLYEELKARAQKISLMRDSAIELDPDLLHEE
ncbi:MAG: hypothetical protein ACXAEF_15065 [Candidatus Thorarchaeota archaeon]|jgi:Arc/MetJ-type ribon-helix-helix transcriptional regulator